jgi:putative flippase GtrA
MRFVVIGVLNTAIDFGVLNLLMILFHTGADGRWYVVFKSISFLTALCNSYFFNKHWVFRSAETSPKPKVAYFFSISVVGFFLNITIASAAFHILGTIYPGHTHLFANVGALMGSCIVLVWNFIGYKFIVFNA